jgi:putative heme-binding domain-containing protein
LVRAPDDASLFKVIREGIPQTEMPLAFDMVDREIWQVVAYVRTLGRTAVESVAGDPTEGERLYRIKGGCPQCHTVNFEGGRMGTPLSEVGARRSPAYLRDVLLEPATKLPEGFLQISVVTKDGQRLTGIRVDEDTYSIQMRDLSDRLHSFWKNELVVLKKAPTSTPMASYREVFSQAELSDVVAYLASLRGGK